MSSLMKAVRVRMAPSPTGRTHIGSGRTALYNYLFARQRGGQFILRIEDTDQKRFVPGAEQELVESLRWLGLDWDEGPDIGGPNAPYHQSQRREIYQQHARQLIERGHAYYCFCTPGRLEEVRQQQRAQKGPLLYDGTCRKLDPDEADSRVAAGERYVVRFKTPKEGSITVRDYLRGDISIENKNLDDYILVKSDGLALYHLAAMVDDHLMDITHVLRGSEWLSTFPLHAHIIRAFGWQEPVWVHLSVFLKPSGKGKMSKRETSQLMQDGYSIFISDLESLGYIPEAVVNWIALMGWSYDSSTEFFSMPALIEKFSLDKLNPAPAAINFTKLDHFNGLHIRSLPLDDLAMRLQPVLSAANLPVEYPVLLKIIPIIRERLTTLDDVLPIAGFFFQEAVHPVPEQLVGSNMSASESARAARRAYQLLQPLAEINQETAEPPLRALADELGLKAGQLFGILRVAVTGQTVSPPLFESMAIVGKGKVMARIQDAITVLESLAGGE
ncbi:MAG: glutamate--tRNA ligase [Chloroflexi bacterium RBG_16_58_14]|nr:MAG: glutamate--tRNA ligase [Chloroflexi bacterium RBG_16_58_14]